MRQLFLLFSGVGGLAGVVIRIRMVYSDEQKLIGEESDYYRSAPANKASPEELGLLLGCPPGKEDSWS